MSSLRIALFLGLLAYAGPSRAAIDPCTPADTAVYVAVDLRQFFDSDFFKDNIQDVAREVLGQLGDTESVLKELGLDPFQHIDRLVLAAPSAKENDRGLIIARGTFDAGKFQARADKLKKQNDESVTVEKVPLGGGVSHPVYQLDIAGPDLPLFVALLDGKTLLVSPGKDYVVDAIKAARALKKPALKNKELAALIERLEISKQAMTLAVPGSALAGLEIPGFDEALGGIEAIGGGLTIGKELKLDLAVSGKSEENAREIRSMLDRGVKIATAGLALIGEDNKELTLAYEVLKSVKVIGKGKVVGVSAQMSAATFQDLFGKGG